MKTVLVVDGDVLVRMPMCVRGIEHREAVKVLEDIRVDMVLSDSEVPGSMNGFGFAQWARSARPELKIVLAGSPQCQHMVQPSCVSRAAANEALRSQTDAGPHQEAACGSGATGEELKPRRGGKRPAPNGGDEGESLRCSATGSLRVTVRCNSWFHLRCTSRCRSSGY